jgi:hypothetical protein
VLDTVQRELRRIAACREVVRGELRTELMRVEASWAGFAMWLSNDTGDVRSRDAWTNRALRLAEEAHYSDMAAFVRSQQSQWAAEELDARRATEFAEDALRIPGTSAQTRALCASWAARGSALTRDASACERRLHDASGLADAADSPAPSWAGDVRIGHVYLRATEARCWPWMQPRKAIPLYESILRTWPHDRMRTGGLHQARLALACAAAGEHDRARAEGRKALAIARSTKSAMVMRELRRLGDVLSAS